MSKKQLEDRIYELKGEITDLYRLAKQCGNKHPENNFMIKDRFELVQKLEKELRGLQENE